MILYEFPLHERIRCLLRLEDVFQRIAHFRDSDSHLHHVCALTALFDLLDILQRSDARGDIMAELDQQGRALSAFRHAPAVCAAALDNALRDLARCHGMLAGSTGRPESGIRDNEWLMGIRSRLSIAGGAADYDMPSFWAWQNLPPDRRRRDIDRWLAPLRGLQESLDLALRLLRESGSALAAVASDGTCQHALSGQSCQLAQLRVDPALDAIPDISANKYLLWIRFSRMDAQFRLQPLTQRVPFNLTLCSL